jgi:hypothetical protein
MLAPFAVNINFRIKRNRKRHSALNINLYPSDCYVCVCTILSKVWSVPLIVSRSTVDTSHRKSTSAPVCHVSCCAEIHSKKNLYIIPCAKDGRLILEAHLHFGTVNFSSIRYLLNLNMRYT